ncbi:hypothetical protein KBI23_22905, partial [bacterium]|nr:hypothetical protein [bacterium]
MKNIVEDAEREKETEAQKALARQASNPASNGAEVKSETLPEPEDKNNTASDTIHNLLHQGKDSLSTRFLSAGQPEIVALPPSTLSRDAANLVDPSFARSQLDSSWHHLDSIKAEVDKNEAAKARSKKNESKRSKEFDFTDPSKSEGQTRLYSGYSEEEPTLLAAQWQCTPDDTLIGSNSSPTEESFNRAAENVSTSPSTL